MTTAQKTMLLTGASRGIGLESMSVYSSVDLQLL